jgi:hypothetical protein
VFSSENELVERCIPLINEFFKIDNYENDTFLLREPKGLFGIPDIMIYNGKIISIEFKLKNWKGAMKQAFRYKCFSFESYVFLDEKYIKKPLENIAEFEKFNIGLCGVSGDNITLYYKPIEETPYSKDLEYKALSLFECVS